MYLRTAMLRASRRYILPVKAVEALDPHSAETKNFSIIKKQLGCRDVNQVVDTALKMMYLDVHAPVH
jgi:hypothetical protein